MKNLLLICASALCFLFLSCKSNKHMESGVNYILELDSEKAVSLLDASYLDFKISDVKRISKSKYQYSARFVCIATDCQTLEKQFEADKSIVKFYLEGNKKDSIMSTKGSKAHRTGPVGSQSGQ